MKVVEGSIGITNLTIKHLSVDLYRKEVIKGVVHFFKKTFADNLLTPMSFKKLRFLIKTFQDFSPYNGLQWGPNGSRSK